MPAPLRALTAARGEGEGAREGLGGQWGGRGKRYGEGAQAATQDAAVEARPRLGTCAHGHAVGTAGHTSRRRRLDAVTARPEARVGARDRERLDRQRAHEVGSRALGQCVLQPESALGARRRAARGVSQRVGFERGAMSQRVGFERGASLGRGAGLAEAG
eukprot:2337137-Prymnesium_polylepis.3